MKSYHPSEIPPRWLKRFGLIRVCGLPGCPRPRLAKNLCQMHYRRVGRHGAAGLVGAIERHPVGARRVLPNGYLVVKHPEHPLAIKGWVKVHRMVLFAAIGPGTHPCRFCGIPVTWGVDLDVDHRDGNRQNNRRSNLSPACRSCNVRKGLAGNPLDFNSDKEIA